MSAAQLCDNGDHDGAQVPAVVSIHDPWGITPRCAYCAEGWVAALIRARRAFHVYPIPEVVARRAIAHLANPLDEGATHCGALLAEPTPWTIDGEDVIGADDALDGRVACAECFRRAGVNPSVS